MQDRLVWLLNRFELRASVFQAGALACGADLDASPGAGYLHLLESGSVRVTSADDTAVDFCEPCAFFYMNPTWHRLQPLDDAVSIVCATFEFGIGAGNPLQQALPELCVLHLADAPGLDATLAQLFAEAADTHCGRDAIIDRLSEVALILILRDLMDARRLDVGLLAGLADPKLAKAINAVHADPAEPWTLVSMASAAGMSRARFAAAFHDVVGMTPGQYLADWRLGLAKSSLLKGRPVQQIAADVGYGSASALARAFAARVGESPSTWRRRQVDPASHA